MPRDPHLEAMSTYLTRAYEYARARRHNTVQQGWAHAFGADEELIYTFNPQEIWLRACALDAEVQNAEWADKLATWRREAIRKVLPLILNKSQTGESACQEADREILRFATHVRNVGILDWFWLLGSVRHHQFRLSLIGFSTIAVWTTLVFFWILGPDKAPVLAQWSTLALALCSGVLGAVVSAAERSTKIQGTSIIIQTTSYVASLSRIPIGAICGLTAWLLALATSAQGAMPLASLLLAAFGAGFTERLVIEKQNPVSDAGGPNRTTRDQDHNEELFSGYATVTSEGNLKGPVKNSNGTQADR